MPTTQTRGPDQSVLLLFMFLFFFFVVVLVVIFAVGIMTTLIGRRMTLLGRPRVVALLMTTGTDYHVEMLRSRRRRTLKGWLIFKMLMVIIVVGHSAVDGHQWRRGGRKLTGEIIRKGRHHQHVLLLLLVTFADVVGRQDRHFGHDWRWMIVTAIHS